MLVYLFEGLPALAIFHDANAVVYEDQSKTGSLDMDLLVLSASRLNLATGSTHSASTRWPVPASLLTLVAGSSFLPDC